MSLILNESDDDFEPPCVNDILFDSDEGETSEIEWPEVEDKLVTKKPKSVSLKFSGLTF